ncbi:MAG TPA: energy transducer TonB [Candidatus Polarisedimenticolaceae bacterium]|nr:energy transducer TonB [Candidatus Polarisedimenticolaceae bacterium]
MFERTLEAHALDAPHAKFSPFSIALLVHLTVFAVIFVISLVMVPKIIEPQPPPEPLIVAIFHEPLEYVREEVANPAPPKPPKGTEHPGPALQPKPEPPKPIETPSETPTELPAPVDPTAGDEGRGQGPIGDTNGSDSGVKGGDGTSDSGGGGNGAGSGTGPVELTPEMVRPVLLHKVQPDYPNVARRIRLEGRVTVQAVIGLDGSVESVEILRSSSPLFEDAALDAVKQWTYRPATMGGQPVRVYFVVEVGFVLR